MAYSLDFRKRVFDIKQKENLSFAKASKRFGIGIRTLFRWQKCIEPKTKRNKPATKIDMRTLQQDVKQHPDAYLSERAERFDVSISCVFYALRRLNISLKKNSVSSQG
jgi:transposase